MTQSFPHERRAVVSLALLYMFRMLGLFMVLPVLFLYGEDYRHSSPQLLGLALGVYGFSQAILQIPFGYWSDRWGRKPVIVVGLGLFALGSVIAALAESVYGLILGRFLQGGGAIAAALMAMVADLTADKNRTKAMAVVGASIGLSFILAMVLGPRVAAAWGGLSAIFWLTAALAGVGLSVLVWLVPKVDRTTVTETHMEVRKSVLVKLMENRELLRFNFGIFCLHFVLVASFAVLPNALDAIPGLDRSQHSWIYLGVLVGSFATMVPFMILAERKHRVKTAFLGAIGLLVAGQFLMILAGNGLWLLLASMFVFFIAFNFLEANLPSLVSKTAPVTGRGTAIGIYSSCQFLGVFLGGTVSGAVLTIAGGDAVFELCIGVLVLWMLAAAFMRNPQPYSNLVVPIQQERREYLMSCLAQLPGVAEVSYLEDESAAFLRVDDRLFERQSLADLEVG